MRTITDSSMHEHTATNPPPGVPDRDAFAAWMQRVQDRFLAMAGNGRALFVTTAGDGIFDAYLAAMPDASRQYHHCTACRRFMERFGALVVLDASGQVEPALWNEDDAPEYYRPAVRALCSKAQAARVDGVFVSSDPVWGTPATGEWRHFAVTPPAELIHRHKLQTPHQRMAERSEDFKNVLRALDEYRRPVVEQALLVLRADDLYRAEKVIGPVEWLLRLIEAREAAPSRQRANVVWHCIANAPAGFCHPRSSMAGTLLDDIAAGLDLDAIKRRFAEKMRPLQYQRPQAAPTEGNLKRGEEIVAKLGIAASLRRRFARPDDLATHLLWHPMHEKAQPATSGVFGHLKPKGAEPVKLNGTPRATMTWVKFARTILPDAIAIELLVPDHGPFMALCTAEDPEAPPILQWDQVDRRNPVSWYTWHGGSQARQFSLEGDSWEDLWGITLKPSMWYGEPSHHGEGIILLPEGCRETRLNGGLALFPEVLKPELREIRATIEAYSRAGSLGNQEGPHACGLSFDGKGIGVNLRVRTKLGVTRYKLDRWD